MAIATLYTIEFVRKVAGRSEPGVITKVTAGASHRNLDAVISQAMSLPRPVEAEGFQIRDNNGPVLHATWF